eukprot:2210355-Lingulodinium_polyedra.AAC.1
MEPADQKNLWRQSAADRKEDGNMPCLLFKRHSMEDSPLDSVNLCPLTARIFRRMALCSAQPVARSRGRSSTPGWRLPTGNISRSTGLSWSEASVNAHATT